MIGVTDRALRAVWARPTGRAGLVLLAALALAALVGPALLPDPAAQGDLLTEALLPPGGAHPFGTDQLSRDVLARTASGLRLSLTLGLLAAVLAVGVGTAVGLVAGAWGGAVDAVLMRLVDALLAIPRLFLLLLALAVWDPIPMPALVLLLGVTGWYGTSRLVRGEAARLREEEFVAAARALGAGRGRIAGRHLLPNVAGPVLVAATLGVGDVMLLEAGLSFLGLGVRPPTPSLGGMIQDARTVFATAPWTSIFPGLAIVLAVLAVNLVGDALRDVLDPRSP
ncbi:MAG TPA: ABC transporter permease [Gemmatimonadales bacterium]|nr:ABC transporter permease [Gemmatimonadales bacterium]